MTSHTIAYPGQDAYPGQGQRGMPGGNVPSPSATRYAMSGDTHVAYRLAGSGPPEVVLVADWFGHVEVAWEEASFMRPALERLASFSRLTLFDKRGVGMSDPVSLAALPTLEAWVDDVRAVMDDAGIRRASLFGVGAGGPMIAMFAASFPNRVDSLVFVNSYARLARDAEYPWGVPPHLQERLLAADVTDETMSSALAGRDASPQFTEWYRRFQRQSVSPGAAAPMRRMMFDLDVRPLLGAIHVPTLVVQRRDDPWIRVGHGRYLAEHIPAARYVELDGSENLFFLGDWGGLIDEVQEFLTGARPGPSGDRLLATILFTDVVSSTEHLARVGDRAWRELLESHNRIVRTELTRHRGREIGSAGDGFLGLFDGPARAIRCADAIRTALADIGLTVRSGLHTGEVEPSGDEVRGIAVHLAARVEEQAQPGEILVSRTVKDLVAGSGIEFVDRGTHRLKGVPDEWQLYAVR